MGQDQAHLRGAALPLLLPWPWAHGYTATPGSPAGSAAGALGPQVGAAVLSPLSPLPGRVALLPRLNDRVACGVLTQGHCLVQTGLHFLPQQPGSRGAGGWRRALAGRQPLARGHAHARARSFWLLWPHPRGHPQLCEAPGAHASRALGSLHQCWGCSNPWWGQDMGEQGEVGRREVGLGSSGWVHAPSSSQSRIEIVSCAIAAT